MDICTTSHFISSLSYPQSRLRTLHNLICDPETLLCNKHFAQLAGSLDNREYLFYAAITINGARMVREAAKCAQQSRYCDIHIIENEIIYSGLRGGSSPLIIESMPEGIRLSEAIYTFSRSTLIRGLETFKQDLQRLDLSHNNLNTNNIIIGHDNKWRTICNYSLSQGYGGDDDSFITIERNINKLALPDAPTAKSLRQLELYSIITDEDGNTIYPIVESRRRFTSKNGVGFKDNNNNVVIPDIYIWASNFSCNRAVVKLREGKMGVIDRNGTYIIEPIYSSIVYNPSDGISIVHNGELQTKFNYIGKQIDEWHE